MNNYFEMIEYIESYAETNLVQASISLNIVELTIEFKDVQQTIIVDLLDIQDAYTKIDTTLESMNQDLAYLMH